MGTFPSSLIDGEIPANAYQDNAINKGTQDPEIRGTNGMTGRVRHGIITVTGPCGQSHSMNFETAIALASWLNQHAQIGLARDAIFRIIENSSS